MLSLRQPSRDPVSRFIARVLILVLIVELVPAESWAFFARPAPKVTVDPNGNRASLSQPNGTNTAYSYNSLNRPLCQDR
jgi:YD repeat-containing protein